MCRLACIPLLLLGWANLIDKSTQVAQPQATLFNKPLKPFSLGESYTTFRLPNAIRYYPERAFHPFYAEADPNDEPNDDKVINENTDYWHVGYVILGINRIIFLMPFNSRPMNLISSQGYNQD